MRSLRRQGKASSASMLGFPGGSDSKESTCSAGGTGLILGQEDSLEKGMATHSGILSWRITWTEETGELYSPRSRYRYN